MKSYALAGAGLGLVAAIAFASATTGPLLFRFLLLFITPLPIALAGLGWGWRAGVIAGFVGAAVVTLATDPTVGLAFAAAQIVPILALTYFAGLSRPIAESEGPVEDDGSGREWYPVGRIVLWAAALATIMAIASMMILAGDTENLRKTLGEFMQNAVTSSVPEAQGQIGEAELAALTEIALAVLPAASAMSWMTSLLFNLWLAGRITHASGQLTRPWPDLASLTYPQGTPFLFGAALIASMLAGLPGLAASAAAGSLFVAYLLLGLAVVHFVTRTKLWRPFALWLLYGLLLVFNIWVAMPIAILGLVETAFRLRDRANLSSPPPTHNDNT